MAQAGYTPISLYYSTTAAAVPTTGNLANGELGLNIADMKLYAKNSAGTVTLLASNAGASGSVTSVAVSGGTTGLTTSGGPITTSGTITLAGTVATTNGGTGLTSFTSGGVVYASSTSALATGSALTFDGSRLFLGTTAVTTSSSQSGEVYSGGAVGFLFTNTTAANYPLSVKNQGTTGTRALINFYEGAGGGTARANISFDGSANFVLTSSNSLVFSPSSAEGMRLTSTGLGIGVTSPAQKLEIAGTLRIKSANADANGLNLSSDAGGIGYIDAGYASVGAIALQTAGVTKFYVGPSGQWGIGGATYGTAGQVLTSGGSGAAPTWAAAAGGGSQAFVAFGSTGGL